MDLQLAGKRAIVNGGARGIGREIVRQLAAEGCHVHFGSRSADLIDLALRGTQGPGEVSGAVCDMRDAPAYEAWLESALERLGGCDLFIHTVSSSGESTTDWDLAFELDMKGAVSACDRLKPALVASGSGSVVLLSSTAAVETFFAPTAFNAMKAALITYGKQLSQAWGPDGVRVNVVTPGPVEFEGGNWLKIRERAEAVYEQARASTALGRLGTPSDVAAAVLFLASPAASYITGTNLIVDGGYTKRVQF